MKEKLFAAVMVSLLLMVSACNRKQDNTQLQVALWYQGAQVNCQAILIDSNPWQLDTLAFYLSDAKLVSAQSSYPVRFYSDVPELQLIRLDSHNCLGQVTLRTEKPFSFGDYLAFTLGVPFDVNHRNPVTQPMPLNIPDMFWTWRNGYKFLRLDMHTEGDNWAYHLGSVGCLSDSAVRAPKSACARPNRHQFHLTIPDAESWTLVLHLDRLIADMSLSQQNRCVMHGETEPLCEHLYRNLSAASPSIFSLEPVQ